MEVVVDVTKCYSYVFLMLKMIKIGFTIMSNSIDVRRILCLFMSLTIYISLKLIKVLFKFKLYSDDACNITFKYVVELLRYIF